MSKEKIRLKAALDVPVTQLVIDAVNLLCYFGEAIEGLEERPRKSEKV
jgi:hypothetical protein